jgi:hypothetical protein
MRKIALIALMAAGLAGCQSDRGTERVLGLGAVGAATGAVIGGVATGDARGAVVGAALGGAGGALVGSAVADSEDQNERSARRGRLCRDYDEYGEPITVRC